MDGGKNKKINEYFLFVMLIRPNIYDSIHSDIIGDGGRKKVLTLLLLDAPDIKGNSPASSEDLKASSCVDEGHGYGAPKRRWKSSSAYSVAGCRRFTTGHDGSLWASSAYVISSSLCNGNSLHYSAVSLTCEIKDYRENHPLSICYQIVFWLLIKFNRIWVF